MAFLFVENQHVAIAFVMAALGFGVVGAQFSILTRLNDMNIDPVATTPCIWKDAMIRITSGVFAALVTYVVLKSGMVFNFINLDTLSQPTQYYLLTDKHFWIVGVMAILAGFSERFVPSFLSKMEERTSDVVDVRGK